MLSAGVSQMLRLFSFTSRAPARPMASTISGFQEAARAVATGKAVVFTSQSLWILTPAGPSTVITDGMPRRLTLPMPQVLATPWFGWPPARLHNSSSVSWAIKVSKSIRPSATSISLYFSSGFSASLYSGGKTARFTGAHSSVS